MFDKVSIVIPVYNSEKFLRESINSVLNQTYKNIEILAIDDGSTDSSSEILQEYVDKIIVLSQQNRGLGVALNTALKQITGKWFKWFSPDDILYHDAIEILVDEIERMEPNTIVYSDWELIDECGKKIRNFYETDYNNLDAFNFNVRLLDRQLVNVNTALIPSSLFKQGCIMEDLQDPVAIDYDFFLRAGLFYDVRFHLISKSLLKYRIHGKQLSHKNIAQSLRYISGLKNQILSQLEISKKAQYEHALYEYNKTKPFTKKVMETSFQIAQNIIPDDIMNHFLLFYLKNIRHTR